MPKRHRSLMILYRFKSGHLFDLGSLEGHGNVITGDAIRRRLRSDVAEDVRMYCVKFGGKISVSVIVGGMRTKTPPLQLGVNKKSGGANWHQVGMSYGGPKILSKKRSSAARVAVRRIIERGRVNVETCGRIHSSERNVFHFEKFLGSIKRLCRRISLRAAAGSALGLKSRYLICGV